MARDLRPGDSRGGHALSETISVDVAVVGGGVVGAATALASATGSPGRPPRRTLLLDAFEPGHDRGSSHGDGRIARFTYAEPSYLALGRDAFSAWRRLETDTGTSILETTGSWEHGPADCAVLDDVAAALRHAELPFDELDAAESRRRFPQLRPAADGRVLYQAEGGITRAETAVATLWRAAAAAGAITWTGRRVERLDRRGDQVIVRGDGFAVEAGAVVIAAGAWSRGLLATPGDLEPIDLPLRVYREAVAYFPEADGAPSHGVGAMPTMIDYHDPERPFYALPRIDVAGVKVGWHRSGPEADPDRPTAADSTVIDRVRRYVGERLPQLVPQPIHVTTCLYTSTPDYHFILDRHPTQRNVVIAAGFSGHGFKFAPVLGEALADLAVDHAPRHDLSPFSLTRFDGERPLDKRRSA